MFTLQLEWIRALHQIRSPTLDLIFQCLNYFDRLEFVFVLIPALWIGISWKTGLRFFYLITLSSFLNSSVKQIFTMPRPFHLDPLLAVIEVPGYGFPSGAAQTTLLLSGLLLSAWKNKPAAIFLSLNYIVWIGLSRVYLGAHFPTDLLGGWFLGFLLLLFAIYLMPRIELWLETHSLSTLLLLSQILPLALLLFSEKHLDLSFASIGVGLGVYLSCRYQWLAPPPETKTGFAVRIAIGIVSLFAVYALVKPLPKPLPMFLAGLWLSFGANLLIQCLCKRNRRVLKR